MNTTNPDTPALSLIQKLDILNYAIQTGQECEWPPETLHALETAKARLMETEARRIRRFWRRCDD